MEEGLYGSSPGKNKIASLVAEVIGTALLVMAIRTAIRLTIENPDGLVTADWFAIGASFFATLTIGAAVFGHVSGGHFNPLVTIALALCCGFPARYALTHIPAQLVGGFLGTGTIWYLEGSDAKSKAALGATLPGKDVTNVQLFLAEMIGTMVLILTILMVASGKDKRAPTVIASIIVGFALGTMVFFFGPTSGGGFNPVRTFVPTLLAGKFSLQTLLYLDAQFVGMLLACGIFKLTHRGEEPTKAEGTEDDTVDVLPATQ